MHGLTLLNTILINAWHDQIAVKIDFRKGQDRSQNVFRGGVWLGSFYRLIN